MIDHALPTRRRKATAHAPSHIVLVKRAYDAPSRSDGQRVLVDRIWPRGVHRDRLALDDWQKDVAPSTALRQWFNHDPARWSAFIARYRAELASPPAREALASLEAYARQGTLTLVYAARDEKHNNAVVLRELITERLASGR